VRFNEIDLFGIYVAPIGSLLVVSWVIVAGLRWIAARYGLLPRVWHPSLFIFSVYMIVLSSIVLIAGR
jgi:hypothetical protein